MYQDFNNGLRKATPGYVPGGSKPMIGASLSNNTKIAIGVAAIALAFLYVKNKK